MDKINWKRKLTSRKFWVAVVGFITQLLIAFNFSNVTVEKVTATVMAAAVLIAYILGEGLADSANETHQIIIPEIPEEKGEEDGND